MAEKKLRKKHWQDPALLASEQKLANVIARVRANIGKARRLLSLEEKDVLDLLYGTGDGCEYSVDEAAKILGLSPRRIRSIHTKAVQKIELALENAQ